ncbi:hypothetical protein JW898_05740 [Candidatus Woesearchaeota archaeon]|nr:hypothetical protein [Candidatus Woesearchaeota archaeon]
MHSEGKDWCPFPPAYLCTRRDYRETMETIMPYSDGFAKACLARCRARDDEPG